MAPKDITGLVVEAGLRFQEGDAIKEGSQQVSGYPADTSTNVYAISKGPLAMKRVIPSACSRRRLSGKCLSIVARLSRMSGACRTAYPPNMPSTVDSTFCSEGSTTRVAAQTYLPIVNRPLEPFLVHGEGQSSKARPSTATVRTCTASTAQGCGFSIVVELTLPMRLARVRFPEAAHDFFLCAMPLQCFLLAAS